MRIRFPKLAVAASLLVCSISALAQSPQAITNIQLGPRPFFLVTEMADGPLKAKLQSCANGPFRKTEFSIGHRGAAMMFPEHTKESYEAAARMGAGIVECDVTFTKDKELVCRHAQNDLHTTTNILATPLAARCTKPFTPFDAAKNTPAAAECRTSDITLAEFKTLRGKMDASNPKAKTVEEFMAGTASWRTDLYSGLTSGTLMTHQESIALFQKLGVKMTPELKSASVSMPFEGFSQENYAQKMIDAYKVAGVPATQVFAQSFNKNDVLYWLKNEPAFGKQAVYLDDADKIGDLPGLEELKSYKKDGIQIVAPPLFALLDLKDGKIVASAYANNAKQAGLGIITWSLERAGMLAGGKGGWYYQTVNPALQHEGDMMQVLDVLTREVGIMGIFSDWPATVTYYANCIGLK
ncbi:glycerophosphodiester phosphodiesterase family protein [Rhodoferax ferrireducens]|uniref:glycerophosphodiester phosphodiesterase family protein n=1 Tax=Rhodoferax ferrireducens TaxID=192843 RepID=UPI000E0CE0FA|nr:glycerophosphodiester phosphodiesterase family protein [Rhodoferax ferrireducens]